MENTNDSKEDQVPAAYATSMANVSRVTATSHVTVLDYYNRSEDEPSRRNTKAKRRGFTGTEFDSASISVAVHGVVIEHPTTYWETLLHMVKGNIGSGIFAMGDAFKNSGLLMGPLLTALIGIICVYGNHVLIASSRELARRRELRDLPSFPETCEWAFEDGPRCFQRFSKTIRSLVKIFNVIAQLGYCSVYVVFVTHTFNHILVHHGVRVEEHLLMAGVFLLMMATGMVRSLKFLVPFSMLANFLIIVGILLTMYISMQQLPPVTSRAYIAPVGRLPLFFGVVMFSYSGIGLVLPLLSDMKRPDRFGGACGVLNLGMFFVTCLMLWMGFVGYLKYGEGVAGTLTLNLPDGLFSQVVQLTIAFALLFSYALQFHVAVCFVWPDIEAKHGPFQRPVVAELCVRLGMTISTLVAAEVVPHLSLFMALIGCVSMTALTLVFPALCDLALHAGQTPGPRYFFDIVSLLLAVVGFSTGLCTSLKTIVDTFVFKEKSPGDKG